MTYQPLLDLIRKAMPTATAVYLFGTAATDQLRPDSDLDLAVLAPKALGGVERWTLQEALAHAAHRDVDLVDLRAASTVMRAQILAESRLLLDLDRPSRELFEATALGTYARLQEERKEIIAQIQGSGHVYG